MNRPYSTDSPAGLLYGVAAYGFWGVVPLYFRQLRHVPADELLAHRIVWSTLLLIVILTAARMWGDLRRGLAVPRTRWTLLLTAILIAINWYSYIYAATHDMLVEASLGYFIAPLASAGLGVVVLRERLRPAQMVALALGATGVMILTVQAGTFPWIALLIAGSFSLYGLFRKTVAADALTGLTVESLLLLPLALGWAVWVQVRGPASFGRVDRATDLWLLAGSVITVVPLYCFAQAARRLRLTTIGFLQYLSPTGQMLLAVYVNREPFEAAKLYGFGPIWVALALYSLDAVWGYRIGRAVSVSERRLKNSGR
jgi:chloramphenicol-sensitive protein RarD